MARRRGQPLDIFTERGMRGPGMFRPQPMGMDLQPIQGVPQQEEEQPAWVKALSAGLAAAPGIIGGLKGDKKADHDVTSVDDQTMTDAAAVGEAMPNKQSALQGVAGKVAGWLNGNDPTEQAAQPAPNGLVQGRIGEPDYMGRYEEALNAPVKKKDAWKDALYKGAVIFSNMMNPQNQMPVVGLGRAQKNRDVAQARGMYEQERELDIARQQDEGRRVQRENTIEDNRRQREDLERKVRADESRREYWNRKADQGDLKLANDAELIELRDKWATSKDANDKRRLDLVEKEMENRQKRADEDRKARLNIAGMRESGQDRRQQIQIQAQREAQAVRDAAAAGRQAEAAAARERLARLKAEFDSLN